MPYIKKFEKSFQSGKPILLQNENLDFDLETQTLQCDFYHYYGRGGYWVQNIIPCETMTCKNLTIPDGSARNIIYNPNNKFREFKTRLNFTCPKNTTLPEIVRFNLTSHFFKVTALKS